MPLLHAPRRNTAPLLGSALVASTLLALATAPAPASAQQTRIAVVELTFGKTVPDDVKGAVRSGLTRAVKADARGLALVDRATTSKQLRAKSPALDGCITPECLARAGGILNAPVGLSVFVGGEAQIYDFVINLFDLKDGTTLTNGADSCDICTTQETGNRFETLLASTLAKTKLPAAAAPAPTATTPKPASDTSGPKHTVNLVVLPSSAALAVGDDPLGKGSASVQLRPGQYTLKADADGYQAVAVPLVVPDDLPGPLQVRLHMAPTASTRVVVERNPGLLSDVNRPALGWTAFGLGTAAAITGGVLLSLDGDSSCASGPITACPNVYETSLAGGTLTGLGTVALTSGLVLLFWDQLAGETSERP